MCACSPPAGVHKTLLQADRTYIDLPLNLFEPVLLCALGCVLTQTDPLLLTPNPLLLEQAAKPLQNNATAAILLAEASTRLSNQLGLPRQDALRAALQDIAAAALPRAVAAAKNNQLTQLFYAQYTPREAVALRYTDGALLDDIAFRDLLEEVHACRFLSDKITILLRLPSLQDLVDALQDDCLTPAEFPTLLQKLDTETVNELQLALPEWFQIPE